MQLTVEDRYFSKNEHIILGDSYAKKNGYRISPLGLIRETEVTLYKPEIISLI